MNRYGVPVFLSMMCGGLIGLIVSQILKDGNVDTNWNIVISIFIGVVVSIVGSVWIIYSEEKWN